MTLCSACSGIPASGLLKSLQDEASEPSSLEERYEHLPQACQLLISASRCPLCAMIVESFIKEIQRNHPYEGCRVGWLFLYENLTGPVVLWAGFPDRSIGIGVSYDTDGLKHDLKTYLYVSLPCTFPNPSFREVYHSGAQKILPFLSRERLRSCKTVSTRVKCFVTECVTDLFTILVTLDNRNWYEFPAAKADSFEAFHLLEYWISNCHENHELCKLNFAGQRQDLKGAPILPSRIIDVGTIEGDQPLKLVEGREMGIRAQYATLSHCWGPPERRPIQTKMSNIERHVHEGFTLSTLTQTFKDAVFVTQKLGLRYLWIDSPCIIQDDVSDWEQESALMGAIYRDSFITISASGASDGTQGCFMERPFHDIISVPLPTSANGRAPGQCLIASEEERNERVFQALGPLEKRAWITQEWILSPRVVHYKREEMAWSCRSLTQSETGLKTSPLQIRGAQGEQAGSKRETWPAVSLYDNWHHLIRAYSSRKLTVITDKLVAIQGLVGEIEQSLGMLLRSHEADGVDYGIKEDTCKYGIWRAKLPEQLIWRILAGGHSQALCDVGIPSWSWASVDGPIAFSGFHGTAAYESLAIKETGVMALRALCERVFATSLGGGVSSCYWPLVGTDGNVVGHAQTDDGNPPVGLLYIMPVSSGLDLRKTRDVNCCVYSLLLEPLEQPGHYRRIGMADGKSHPFHSSETKDIFIV